MPGACRRVTRSAVRTHLTIPSYLGPVPHDASYYAKCMLGGALACGTTHSGITPLDVTKCNMQVCTAHFAFRIIRLPSLVHALAVGCAPTPIDASTSLCSALLAYVLFAGKGRYRRSGGAPIARTQSP